MNWGGMVDAFNAVPDGWKQTAVALIVLWAVVFAIKWWPRRGAPKEK